MDSSGRHKSALLEQVRTEIRVRHYSYRTEQAYIAWIVRFIRFNSMRHPREMGETEIAAFLSHLATQREVAASTQNQAFNAIRFLYDAVLGRRLDHLQSFTRSKRPARLPVVLTAEEVGRILRSIDTGYWLPACLMYGSGLRVMETVRLRTKDLDFDHRAIYVRSGKGDRDRVVTLPDEIVVAIRRHLQAVRLYHEKDLADGFGEAALPFALERKYPGAGRQWAWQFVFPARRRSIDPRSGRERRHHVDVNAATRRSRFSRDSSADPRRCL